MRGYKYKPRKQGYNDMTIMILKSLINWLYGFAWRRFQHWLIDNNTCIMVLNTVFNVTSVISCLPVHLTMLSCIFVPELHTMYFQVTDCFPP